MLNFGGFLSSNFWNTYRCQTSPSIEELLNNKECTVDKLLDDEDCLQEFKNFNEKLIKYFDHDKLKVLVDYITVMPEEDAGYQRGRKYPFLSGEIFNCEINGILDKFFEAPVKVVQDKDEDGDFDEDDDRDSAEKDSNDKAATDSDEDKKSSDDKDEKDTEEPTAAAKNLEEASAEDAATDKKADSEDKQPEEKKTEGSDEKDQKSDDEKKDENPQNDSESTEVKAEPAAEEAKKDKDAVEEEKKEDADSKKDESQKNSQEPEAEEQATTAAEETKDSDKKDDKDSEEKPAEEKKEAKKVEPEEEEPAKTTEDTSSEEKKSSEESNDKSKDEKSEENTTVASTLVTESNADPEEEDDESDNKYMLLERLFKFIKVEAGTTEETQLNPVLAGYFCKLVSLLISRKQKQLVPFVFAPGSEIIDYLLKHIYQRSIAEILSKFLTQVEDNYGASAQMVFEPEVAATIKEKQHMAVAKLIDLLGPQVDSETNLNACTIIQDLYETKEYYNIILAKENLEKIVDFATQPFTSGSKSSKSTSLQVLN